MSDKDNATLRLVDVTAVDRFTKRLEGQARDPYSLLAIVNFKKVLSWLVSLGVPIYEATGTIHDCSGAEDLDNSLPSGAAQRTMLALEGIGYRFELVKGNLSLSWSVEGLGSSRARKSSGWSDPHNLDLELPFAQFGLNFSTMEMKRFDVEEVSADVVSGEKGWICMHADAPGVALPPKIYESFPEGSQLDDDRAFAWLGMMWQFFQSYSEGN